MGNGHKNKNNNNNDQQKKKKREAIKNKISQNIVRNLINCHLSIVTIVYFNFI
jgi:hypothetical protein